MKAFLLALLLIVTPLASADAGYPPQSIYNLHANLIDQSGTVRGLDMHRGHPVLVTMFYGSCPATCPLIIDTMRAIEKKLDDTRRQDLRVLLVSIDPERDTPASLRQLADSRRVDTTRWTLAHADANAVRRIAAALSVQYKKLPDGQFSHSTVISTLDANGKIVVQSAELGHADPQVLQAINAR